MKQTNVKQIIKLINENPKLVFLQDVYQSLGMSSSTFYRKYPKDSKDYNEIVEALDLNKTTMKREIRDRLMESKTPASLIFLYKILTPDLEERKLMDGKYPEEKMENNEEEIKIEIE